jgi:hypothetical protein
MGWGDFVDFCEDVADVAIETVQVAADVCEVAGPVVMAANPGVGTAMMQFAQYENMADPYLEKAQAKLNDDESPKQKQNSFVKGEFSQAAIEAFLESQAPADPGILPGDSLATVLAKVFGAQLDQKEQKIRDLATTPQTGEGAASNNALIAAAASDLTNLASISSKAITSVTDAQTSALGRTN